MTTSFLSAPSLFEWKKKRLAILLRSTYIQPISDIISFHLILFINSKEPDQYKATSCGVERRLGPKFVSLARPLRSYIGRHESQNPHGLIPSPPKPAHPLLIITFHYYR